MRRTADLIDAHGIPQRRRPVPGDLRWDGRLWRRWSGRRWARAVYSADPPRLLDPTPLDRDVRLGDAERTRLLAWAVEHQVTHNGAAVVHEGPSGVVLAYRERVSYGFHAVITVLTAGLWLVVFLLAALSAGRQRVRLACDPWGHVWATSLRPD